MNAAGVDGPLTYAAAGVSIAAGDDAVRRLAPHARSTFRPEVLTDIGSFGAVTALPAGMTDPVLVTANDGAGTKPLIAAALGRWDTIGVDVVAMCVDDIAPLGAAPLLFHDQITAGALDPAIAEQIVIGLAAGCRTAGCALVGGEIAEHPDSLAPGDYDIAGFVVGVAERDRLTPPLGPEPATLIGLASGGLRCNGYSLARRVLLGGPAADARPADAQSAHAQVPPSDVTVHSGGAATSHGSDQTSRLLEEPAWPGAASSLGDELLRPSVIYAPTVLALYERCCARGAAHITGGGLQANLARMLGAEADAVVHRGTWPVPPIFDRIAAQGPVAPAEMEQVFNLGVGMVVAVPPDQAAAAIDLAQAAGHEAWPVGHTSPGTGTAHVTDLDQ